MLKDATYKEKFVLLQDWLLNIVETVKKDLKTEHLKKDNQFLKKYFEQKNLNKLTSQELADGYRKALDQEEHSETIAEFISNRWLLKNSEIYNFFEQELGRINPNFTELNEIDQAQSLKLMENAISQFGAIRTYLFSIINSVVFPKSIYEQLQQRAKGEAKEEISQAQTAQERHSLDSLRESYEQQIARLTDKYEKKVQGLQKKYVTDIDALKKQIATLQRKLNG